MYRPRHFAVDDQDEIASFVDGIGAADFVTFDGTRLVASLLPVIWDRAAPGHGRLLAHLAVANPQWRSTRVDAPALAIVHGPQAYVSPSWYASKQEHGRVVPTWNYVAVHFTGTVQFHRDPEWLRDVVTALTRRHELHRSHPWAVSDAPADYLDKSLKAIVGVEMRITDVEAKAKLSQNRSRADQDGVIAGLRTEDSAAPTAVADLMQARLSAETRESS